jgi:hypothetical protein
VLLSITSETIIKIAIQPILIKVEEKSNFSSIHAVSLVSLSQSSLIKREVANVPQGRSF